MIMISNKLYVKASFLEQNLIFYLFNQSLMLKMFSINHMIAK